MTFVQPDRHSILGATFCFWSLLLGLAAALGVGCDGCREDEESAVVEVPASGAATLVAQTTNEQKPEVAKPAPAVPGRYLQIKRKKTYAPGESISIHKPVYFTPEQLASPMLKGMPAPSDDEFNDDSDNPLDPIFRAQPGQTPTQSSED